ncbi:uncharacterized protein ARMOST_18585 [Armillaria ostoyae]|uniref:Apiosidase-like catalytic domain-containing protein n=1 Tax=Armillaria ostoyae TaxID=47428 RepID=A0A284S264_ARMOS|nr:uncharacterized protein ARMOST_18585 [Armillaria ostoyae]
MTVPNVFEDLSLILRSTRVDTVIDKADAVGVRIALVPTWESWITGGWQDLPAPHAVNTTNAAVFSGFIGKRYVGIPESMGGDTNTSWPPRREISTIERSKANQTDGARIRSSELEQQGRALLLNFGRLRHQHPSLSHHH